VCGVVAIAEGSEGTFNNEAKEPTESTLRPYHSAGGARGDRARRQLRRIVEAGSQKSEVDQGQGTEAPQASAAETRRAPKGTAEVRKLAPHQNPALTCAWQKHHFVEKRITSSGKPTTFQESVRRHVARNRDSRNVFVQVTTHPGIDLTFIY